MSVIATLKKDYLARPMSLKRQVQKHTGIKIKNVEFIEDTPDFNKLLGSLQLNKSEIFKNVEPFVIHSILETPKGVTLKVHNSLTFVFHDGSFVRIAPTKDNKLDITRIETSKPGNGTGKLLMGCLFDYINYCLGYIPPIQVEIVGAVGFGATYKTTPIEVQQNFFEQFDFKVIKKSSRYVQLERERQEPSHSRVCSDLSQISQP